MSTSHRDSYSDEADAEHMRFCENDPSGPVCKVRLKLKELGDRMTKVETEMAEGRGAAKQQAKNLTIMVAVFGAVNVLVALAGLLLKLRGQG